MKTYQDLLAVPERDKDRADFAEAVINEYRTSNIYQTAKIADDYDRCRNTTTMQYQKMITDIKGQKYVDQTATVHRSTSNFFNVFTTQLNQYLLGNGATWDAKDMGEEFDRELQSIGKAALVGGVAYGLWDVDHVQKFTALEFAPLYDEENGALSAGVRFWQIDESKPLRATLYEPDGFTHYLWDRKHVPSKEWQKIDDGCYMMRKMPYKLRVRETAADGAEIYAGENYPTFPIVPLWGNPNHQSELVGLREKIDAYDFILNGWEDDLDNAQLYWMIKGAGGMDDPDLAKFLDRLRNTKAAAPEDGQEVTPVTVEIPVAARSELLERLEKQLYKDAMILNPADIAGGAATATQIKAAYEPQNVKADQYEYCVLDFISGILSIAGIESKATFTRSQIVNTQEEVTTVIQAATYLSEDYVTRKILNLLGDGDQAEDIIKELTANAEDRMAAIPEEPEEEEDGGEEGTAE